MKGDEGRYRHLGENSRINEEDRNTPPEGDNLHAHP